MNQRKIGGLTVIIPGTPQEADAQARFLQVRGDFFRAECKRRGWSQDPTQLSMEQIMEIRAMDGWKSPK